MDPASIKIQEPVIDDDDEDEDDDDDMDDDGDINPKMEKAITIMGIAAGVVIIIIIIYLCITLAGGMKSSKDKSSNTETTKTETQTGDSQTTQTTQIKDGVVVPSLTGKTMDQAKQEINGTGLGIKQAGTASSDTVEKGQIISQDPQDGKTVEKNTTIEVIISSGSAANSENAVDIPNVVGQSETDASAALTAKGFNVTKTTSYSSSVAEGYVISQTPNGDTQGKGGDTIALEISLGSEKITVPNVVSGYKSEQQAREILSQFNVSTDTKYSDTVDEGIVMAQSLAAGTQADPGASITITVSLGAEPAQQITTKTYKLNVSLQLPSDTSNISGADIVLYDNQGNVLQTWYGKTISDFGSSGLLLTKTGILSDNGKIVVTWLDLNGNDLKDQTIDVQFQEE